MSRRSNDKNQAILKALLKEPGNGHCADCKTSTHPRWASWNLGIFICIRCSGIHRSMGTHISRVKSVDLDTWTDEQVASMVKWGNNKANTFWEAKFPGGKHIPDQSKIENFIRTKYDMKKWAASSTVPDPSTISASGSAASSTAASMPSVSSVPANNSRPKLENRRSLNSTLLDLEFGAPVTSPPPANSSTQSLPQSTLITPQLTSNSSTNFPAPPQQSTSQPPQQHVQQQHQQQQQQQQQQRDNRPDLKKSILSLYSTPMASTSTPNFPMRNNTMNASSQSFQSASTTNNNSLSGLNFSTSTSFQQPQAQAQPAQNTWASQNVWETHSPASSSTTTTKSTLDDDLFKNVWK